MSETHQQIAEQLIATFTSQLTEAGHETIPQSLLAELAFQIREAMDAQSESIAHQLEQLALTLHQSVDKSEIAL